MKPRPPSVRSSFARRFDKEQMQFYSRSNNVPITGAVRQQVNVPLRYGGQGFAPLATLRLASYAANIIDSEAVTTPEEPDAV